MTLRPKRPCLDCRRLTNNGSRCARCQSDRDAQRNASRPHYADEWRDQAKAQIARVPYCENCGATEDLTADHVRPRDPSKLQTLCRTCNGRKADRESPGQA